MKVICAGWGRTGTRSLKYALEYLNSKPSYHMQNILLNKNDATLWHNLIFNNTSTAYNYKCPGCGYKIKKDRKKCGGCGSDLAGDKYNWEDIFEGYAACLDFPSCNYYKELMEFYPDAKVILTIRDDESWIKSWNVLNNQVLNSFTFKFLAKIPYTSFKLQKDIHNKMILGEEGAFKGATTDKAIKQRFNEWNQSVIDYVPKDRLLIYQVKDGWKPICDFIDKPIPDIPFPYKNKTKNMGHISRFINIMFIIIIIISIVMIISSAFFGIQYFG